MQNAGGEGGPCLTTSPSPLPPPPRAHIGRPIGWICLENGANTEMLLIPPSRDAHDDSEKERRARASPLN